MSNNQVVDRKEVNWEEARPRAVKKKTPWKKWLLILHRDLGFLFAGVVLIYAISGIAMNHRSTFNPNYSAELREIALDKALPTDRGAVDKATVDALLAKAGEEGNYSKHYFSKQTLKVLLKGGSTLNVDLGSRTAILEKISERVVLGSMTKLHYNPGRWWTGFSDAFAIALILITLTGLAITHGRKGLLGRGGLLFLLGLAVPLAFLLLM